MTTSPPIASPPRRDIGFKQFVALMAALMATNALALDVMLPALAVIGNALDLSTPNEQQWIITAYLVGGGTATLLFGPLSDRYGRKPMLLIGLSVYVVFAIVGSLATSFETMMVARVIQGAGAAAPRVLVSSIIRDRYAGRQMARVMSLTFIVLLAVPLIAPSVGQAMLLFAPWRWLFASLAAFGAVVMIWIVARLPETLHPEDRRPISLPSLREATRIVTTNRITMGYMFAQVFNMRCTFAMITMSQQVFVDVFKTGVFFPVLFAGVAASMGVASFINARIVGKFGMRMVSHGGLMAYVALALIHVLVMVTGYENLIVFLILQSALVFCVGLMGPNFNAMAMEPMGHVAGTASSIMAFTITVGGGLLGLYVAQHFEGTAAPQIVGNVIFGVAMVICVLIAEKGRLFRPTTGPVPASAGKA